MPLEVRAARIDPRSAHCFNGAYCESFSWRVGDASYEQDVVSSALVWLMPGIDIVPDSAMRDAWTELAGEWDELLAAAWARSHPRVEPRRQA